MTIGAERIRKRWDLSALGAIDVRAGAEEDFGGLHHRFRECGMRMNSQGYVAGHCRHFDAEHALCDHLTGACADNAYTEHALGLRIEKKFGHTFRQCESDGKSG